ncbi:hypothetical protein [Thermus antranikianii]|uniref:hypothetical protein n=1 Tax=Thermus antranikianii TaxID=88190 RepID=UPI001C784457|nr:hypothetical protein [Thermus antranikianii]QWK20769.1 MAG: hypothetical protein KNN15_06750 [Thermus antranikianii]
MARLTHVLAEPRPEGGAVRIRFMRPEGYPEVRVLRAPEGVALTGPEDPAGFLVWNGPPGPPAHTPSSATPTPACPRLWRGRCGTSRPSPRAGRTNGTP